MPKNNIRELRRSLGWTMDELAERVEGKPHFTTIAKLERNERGLSQSWMEKIAVALGVTPAELISEQADQPRPRLVPVIGSIAQGSWREAIQEPLGHVWATTGGPNVFGLRPEGTSMNRVIMEGATVLVDPDQLDLFDGKIYAVRNEGGEATVKLYRADPPRLEPCSTDPAHEPIIFGREPFTLIGRVVGQTQEL